MFEHVSFLGGRGSKYFKVFRNMVKKAKIWYLEGFFRPSEECFDHGLLHTNNSALICKISSILNPPNFLS